MQSELSKSGHGIVKTLGALGLVLLLMLSGVALYILGMQTGKIPPYKTLKVVSNFGPGAED